METNKDQVRLRKRIMPSGNTSLYLAIDVGGRRRYEYLKLYLIPGEREKNRETLALAEAICAKRLVEVHNGEYGFRDKTKEDALFLPFFEMMALGKIKEDTRGNYGNWKTCLRHLRLYDKNIDTLSFRDITREWVSGFLDYLKTASITSRTGTRGLSSNTITGYMAKVRTCINKAYNTGIVSKNPLIGVEPLKMEAGTRMYLTLDEVKDLANTECDRPSVKTAFLFSCLTGLRRSDIEKLTWADVHQDNGFTRIIFRQKKTHGLQYLDITPEAAQLMGERGRPGDKVFRSFLTAYCTNTAISRWCARAGITKSITFHCARHTFATMMLTLGTDLYTVSKLLGHSNIATTQIYAKVIDKNKQEAVMRIPSILPKE